nr:Tn3 family transposase [Streptomyces hydrogenans]
MVLWNTRYLDAAIAQLRAEGQGIKGEDVARLSPPMDLHINFLGHCLFTTKASGPGQGLRLFRDPDAVADDEDEERRAAHPTCRTVHGGIRPARSGRCNPCRSRQRRRCALRWGCRNCGPFRATARRERGRPEDEPGSFPFASAFSTVPSMCRDVLRTQRTSAPRSISALLHRAVAPAGAK